MLTIPAKLPIRTAIAGIGGFGAAHHSVQQIYETAGLTRVVATCDPALSQLEEICTRHDFAGRNVRTYEDFETMLAKHGSEIDLGIIATPIQCHAPMHEAYIRNGSACYLEKPPTLDPEELDRMLVVEESARIPSNVGFSHVFVPERLALKQRMLDGEFGQLKRISFLGLTPRRPAYFARSNWAGKLLLHGNLLLDSCLGNAMSHYLNSLLLFGHQGALQEWARPKSLDCELYRANPIEGTDTIFVRGQLDNGVEFRVAGSHACSDESIFEERMEFTEATIIIRGITEVTIERPGRPTETESLPGAALKSCVSTYLEFLQGHLPRPSQRLVDCRGFVETNALFYLAAGQIHTLPELALSQATPEDVIELRDVGKAGRRLLTEGLMPTEAGYSWAAPGGSASLEALPQLRSVIDGMKDSGSLDLP